VRAAIAKALGEAVEWYCAAFSRSDDLIYSRYRDPAPTSHTP
jgi:hypothetical protein